MEARNSLLLGMSWAEIVAVAPLTLNPTEPLTVVSPTFTMAVRYEGRLPLVHYDLYRVRSERELVEMGFLESDDPREVALVEWGDRTEPPAGAIRVRIEIEPDGSRTIDIDGIDPGEAT